MNYTIDYTNFYIYKQFHQYQPLAKMKGLQWFAIEPNYGENYGPIHKKYKFKKQPNLLDIGNGHIREMIEEKMRTNPSDYAKILEYSHPDYQYSGGEQNAKYHNLVKKYFTPFLISNADFYIVKNI